MTTTLLNPMELKTYFFIDFRSIKVGIFILLSSWFGSISQEIHEIRFLCQFREILLSHILLYYFWDGCFKPILVLFIGESVNDNVNFWLKQDCIPVGCVPPACWPYLWACSAAAAAGCVYLVGGGTWSGGCTWFRGCTWSGGVPGPGGCTWSGGCQVLPPVNRITHTCKNITLPQLRCGR